jgi:hypothetical protein
MSKKLNNRTYPYYGKLNQSEQVVLFTKPQAGTVVTPAFDEFGYYCETWDESIYTVVDDDKSIRIGKRPKPMSDIQREALRLMNEDGTNGRHMARLIGTQHQYYSNLRTGNKRLSRAMAVRVVEAFNRYAERVTPRVNNEDGN